MKFGEGVELRENETFNMTTTLNTFFSTIRVLTPSKVVC
jgi:hypothetical protein